MDHGEAVREMAAERYLLDELSPEAREQFEEHIFDCSACAQDLSAGVMFVEEARGLLPELTVAASDHVPEIEGKPVWKWDSLFSWIRPAFAAPAFAALVLVIGYQNLITFPALRQSVGSPRLLPVPATALHGATRGGAQKIEADPKLGVALPIILDQQPDGPAYASYRVELQDSAGKAAWSQETAPPPANGDGEREILLALPGMLLHAGAYTVIVDGIADNGKRTPVARYVFDLKFIS